MPSSASPTSSTSESKGRLEKTSLAEQLSACVYDDDLATLVELFQDIEAINQQLRRHNVHLIEANRLFTFLFNKVRQKDGPVSGTISRALLTIARQNEVDKEIILSTAIFMQQDEIIEEMLRDNSDLGKVDRKKACFGQVLPQQWSRFKAAVHISKLVHQLSTPPRFAFSRTANDSLFQQAMMLDINYVAAYLNRTIPQSQNDEKVRRGMADIVLAMPGDCPLFHLLSTTTCEILRGYLAGVTPPPTYAQAIGQASDSLTAEQSMIIEHKAITMAKELLNQGPIHETLRGLSPKLTETTVAEPAFSKAKNELALKTSPSTETPSTYFDDALNYFDDPSQLHPTLPTNCLEMALRLYKNTLIDTLLKEIRLSRKGESLTMLQEEGGFFGLAGTSCKVYHVANITFDYFSGKSKIKKLGLELLRDNNFLPRLPEFNARNPLHVEAAVKLNFIGYDIGLQHTPDYSTILVKSVKERCTQLTSALLELEHDPEDVGRALHIAMTNGDLTTTQALLERPNINVNISLQYKTRAHGVKCYTPLMIAAENGWEDIIDRLLQFDRLDIHSSVLNGRPTAIYLAVKYGHLAIARRLLADPRVNSAIELVIAAYYNDMDSFATLCSLREVDVNRRLGDDHFPRFIPDNFWSVGNPPILLFLLSNYESSSITGKAIELLLSHSQINTSLTDTNGYGVHDLALRIPRCLRHEIVKQLIATEHFDVNNQNKNGITLLMDIVGLDHTRRNPLDSTFLDNASGKSCFFAMMNRTDLDINRQCRNGYTALMHFFLRKKADNHPDVLAAFLNREDINLDIRDNNGCSALDIAKAAGHVGCVRRLSNHADNDHQTSSFSTIADRLASAIPHQENSRMTVKNTDCLRPIPAAPQATADVTHLQRSPKAEQSSTTDDNTPAETGQSSAPRMSKG